MRTNKITKSKHVVILFILVMMIFACGGCRKSDDTQGPLVIVGSGASEEILKKLAEAYSKANPGCEVIVPKSIGSGGGISAVGNDEYILGRVSRPIKDSEAHFGLSYLPFAKDVIVFAVGDGVKIESLTETQLIDIYSGKIDNWGQLGCEMKHIRALAREKGETSRTIIEKDFPAFRDFELGKRVKLVYHDYEVVDSLIKYPTAIGYLTNSSVKPGINPISFNGISPTIENVLSGKYPFTSNYAFIYKKKKLNDAAKRFINFVFSDEGKRVLEANGLSAIYLK